MKMYENLGPSYTLDVKFYLPMPPVPNFHISNVLVQLELKSRSLGVI